MAYTGPKVFYIILTILVCGAITAGGVLCALPVFELATMKAAIPKSAVSQDTVVVKKEI